MRAALHAVTLGACLGVSGCLFQPDEEERISCMQDEDCPGSTWCGGVARVDDPSCADEFADIAHHKADGTCSFLYCIDGEEGEACGDEGNRCSDNSVCVLIKGTYPLDSEPYWIHHCAERPLIDRAALCYGLDNPPASGYDPLLCDDANQACLLVFERYRYGDRPPFRCVLWEDLPDPPAR